MRALFVGNTTAVVTAVLVLAAVVQTIIAGLVWRISSRQAGMQRLNALRDLFARHHSQEITQLRNIVRFELPRWIDGRDINVVRADPEFPRFQRAFEDALNYYEYLGTILRVGAIDESIIVESCHNSTVDIWDNIFCKYLSYFEPENGRVASDYAGSFKVLVTKAKKYRARNRIVTGGKPAAPDPSPKLASDPIGAPLTSAA